METYIAEEISFFKKSRKPYHNYTLNRYLSCPTLTRVCQHVNWVTYIKSAFTPGVHFIWQLKILTVYQRSQIFARNKVVQVLSYRSPLLKWPELSSFVWKTTRITQQKYYLHMLWSTTNPERTKSKVCVTTAMRSNGEF